ncbi:MAG: glutamate-5-semialdehyde dehydrogenase [Polyangiaceae bacterium]|nr:glutamate-5-semialdehyde dehydrogenase [Polyangiaceae bacterium]
MTKELEGRCHRARAAARVLAALDRRRKDAVLAAIAARLEAETEALCRANAEDLERARAAGLEPAMLDRLALDPVRVAAIAAGVREIVALEDPVGEVTSLRRRPNGMQVGRMRIPLGVIAMIYEARPNVTIDAAALCLKSGNAVLLRGGKEAARSNAALGDLVRAALAAEGLPEDAVQVVPPLGREETKVLLGLAGLIDLCIPRGGEGLIRFVTEHARVPVVQHYKGVCHLFVDEDADLDMALAQVENGKLSRPGVCNALECLLVHERVAAAFVPRLAELVGRGLEVRGDEATVALLPAARPAAPDDWGQEFLARILAVRVVPGFDAALDHIARYGSLHTEAICTRSYARAQRFLREVDASCVLVNASTRFNDGGMLGLGAEMGISTSKLHAFGPMGLESLTTLKWIVTGDGQVRT